MSIQIETASRKSRIELTEDELRLQSLSRAEALLLEPELRMHWFAARPVWHRELKRVVEDVEELMDDDNEVSIISVIGLSGVGKTTAAGAIRKRLVSRYAPTSKVGQMPVLYVEAPANGERDPSWRELYKRILHAGGEFAVSSMRRARFVDGRLTTPRGNASTAELRECVEDMVRNRGIRTIIIDEALHLLRFDHYDVMMDTLKSLSNIAGLKLILIGSYQIAPLMVQYGQVARRSEIVHFRTYTVPQAKKGEDKGAPIPAKPTTGTLPSDARAFFEVLEKCLAMWPCATVPDLRPHWQQLMEVCLGSAGLLKMLLLRLAAAQMKKADQSITAEMLGKAGKSAKALSKLKEEQSDGLADLEDACYGEGRLVRAYPEVAKALVASTSTSAANQEKEKRFG